MVTLAERTKAFRHAKRWSVTRLAKELKTSRQNIDNVESGKSKNPKFIIALEGLLECPAEAQITDNDDRMSTTHAAATIEDDSEVQNGDKIELSDRASRQARVIANMLDLITDAETKNEVLLSIVELISSKVNSR